MLDLPTNQNDAAALKKSETLLREAFNADLYCAPAHNNCGVIFLVRDEL